MVRLLGQFDMIWEKCESSSNNNNNNNNKNNNSNNYMTMRLRRR